MVDFGFLPYNFGGGVGTYKLSYCLKMNTTKVVWTIIGGVDTQILVTGNFFLNFMHSQPVGTQKLCNSPWLPSTSTPYKPPGETFTA